MVGRFAKRHDASKGHHAPLLVVEGERAKLVHWVPVLALIVTLLGAFVTYFRNEGERAASIVALDRLLSARIDAVVTTLESLRQERTALIAQGTREKDEIHQDIRELRGQVAAMQQSQGRK